MKSAAAAGTNTVAAGTVISTIPGASSNQMSLTKSFVKSTKNEEVLQALNPFFHKMATAGIASTGTGTSTGPSSIKKSTGGMTLTGTSATLSGLKSTGLDIESEYEAAIPGTDGMEFYSNSVENFGTHYMVFSFSDNNLKKYCVVLITLLSGIPVEQLDDLIQVSLLPDKSTLHFESVMPTACFNKDLITDAVYQFFTRKKKEHLVQTVSNMVLSFDTEVKRIRSKMNLKADQAISGTIDIPLPFFCEKIAGQFHAVCPSTAANILYVLLNKKPPTTEETKPKIKRLQLGGKRSYEELLSGMKSGYQYYKHDEESDDETRENSTCT